MATQSGSVYRKLEEVVGCKWSVSVLLAADSRIDALRGKMEVVENAAFSTDYLDPGKRSIGNAIQILFKDGSKTERVVEYLLGHRRRRAEGIPLLLEKVEAAAILVASGSQQALEEMPVNEFMDLWYL